MRTILHFALSTVLITVLPLIFLIDIIDMYVILVSPIGMCVVAFGMNHLHNRKKAVKESETDISIGNSMIGLVIGMILLALYGLYPDGHISIYHLILIYYLLAYIPSILIAKFLAVMVHNHARLLQ